MPKFAVAFVDQKVPKHDKVILEEKTHDVVYYNGDVEVLRLPNFGVGYVFVTALHQSIEEAKDVSEAAKKVREWYPYQILEMVVTELK